MHHTLIVFDDFEGNSEVLFHGNQGLLFTGPQVVDDERIAFIASVNGKRELWLYNYVSRELFRVENSSGANDYWHFMRSLGVSEGKLFFSHNSDDRMYKLAVLDLENMRAVFNQRDFSGAVFNPVSLNDHIYYLGNFTRRDRLLRFPEAAASLSGDERELVLVALDRQNYYDEPFETPYTGPSGPYHSIRYMNPFRTWLPLFLIRDLSLSESGLNARFGGAGIFSIVTDPTDRHLISVIAYADIPYQMAMIDQFS